MVDYTPTTAKLGEVTSKKIHDVRLRLEANYAAPRHVREEAPRNVSNVGADIDQGIARLSSVEQYLHDRAVEMPAQDYVSTDEIIFENGDRKAVGRQDPPFAATQINFAAEPVDNPTGAIREWPQASDYRNQFHKKHDLS